MRETGGAVGSLAYAWRDAAKDGSASRPAFGRGDAPASGEGTNGFAVYPLAGDERCDGLGGDACDAVVDHADHEVDRRFADQIVALIHSRPVWVVGSPFVLDETDVVRDVEVQPLQPLGCLVVEREEHVWTVGVKPVLEGREIASGLFDLGEGRDGGFRGAVLLFTDEEASGEPTIEEGVNDRIEDESRAAVPEAPGLFVRLQGECELIRASEGELGIADSDAGHGGGNLIPQGAHLLRKPVVVEESDDDGTPYAAGSEDGGESTAGHAGFMEPELVERISELMRPLLHAAQVNGNSGVFPCCVLVLVRIEQSEGWGEAGGSCSSQFGHEFADGCVSLVAELGCGLSDTVSGIRRDARAVPKRETHGVF